MMKPFILLQTRDDQVATEETTSVATISGLGKDNLQVIRLDKEVEAGTHFDWEHMLGKASGLIIGGSAYNVTDPDDVKTELQHRVEEQFHAALDTAAKNDVPYLGICYGLGIFAKNRGGVVDRTYGENASPIPLTIEDPTDPLLAKALEIAGTDSHQFTSYVAHGEAVREIPEGAKVIVSGENCPVQALRWGKNMYATQFHPELAPETMEFRLNIYAHHGYFAPEELQNIVEKSKRVNLDVSHAILRAFAQLFAK